MWTLKRVLRLMFAAEEYRQRHSSVDEALAHDWMMVQGSLIKPPSACAAPAIVIASRKILQRMAYPPKKLRRTSGFANNSLPVPVWAFAPCTRT